MKKARSVTCVDFMPSVLAVNRKAREGCGNVKFIHSDVTQLDQPNHRFIYSYCVQLELQKLTINHPINQKKSLMIEIKFYPCIFD